MSGAARILEVRELTYGYPDLARPVLDHASLTLDEGEIVILSGPSGSGKSTMMSLIGLLRLPPAGTVSLFGTDPAGLGVGGLARLRRRMRFIFQRHHLLRSLTVLQNVVAGVVAEEGSDAAWDQIRAARFLEAIGLGDHLHRWPHELSGGQQQRVAVARALVSLPDLLLADEPTASLDTENARLVATRIRDLAHGQGCGVILATHDERLMDLATRRIRLRDGRIEEIVA